MGVTQGVTQRVPGGVERRSLASTHRHDRSPRSEIRKMPEGVSMSGQSGPERPNAMRSLRGWVSPVFSDRG
jgi:hypothetical protein